MRDNAPIFLADLDDTLFQTLRKCPRDIPEERLKPASWTADGKASGYQTPRQQGLLEWMRSGEVIPVTARSLEVTERTIIGIQGRAICANGGLILDRHGRRDEDWHAHLKNASVGGGNVTAAYAAILPVLDRYDDLLRHWIVREDDLDLYVVIKHNNMTDSDLLRIGMECTDHLKQSTKSDDWHVHSNGNNFAILPHWLGKRHAARRLIDMIRTEDPDRNIIGLGDSRTDAAYMLECDYVMTPSASQLAELIRSRSE